LPLRGAPVREAPGPGDVDGEHERHGEQGQASGCPRPDPRPYTPGEVEERVRGTVLARCRPASAPVRRRRVVWCSTPTRLHRSPLMALPTPAERLDELSGN